MNACAEAMRAKVMADAGLREGGRWKYGSVELPGSRQFGNRQSMTHAGLVLAVVLDQDDVLLDGREPDGGV